ncbi:MAG: alpha/beta fold hydrolase [Nibricoccus sp.]
MSRRKTDAFAERRNARSVFWWLAVATVLISNGCFAFPRKAVAPIPTLKEPLQDGARADTLIVFLPGRGDSVDAYRKQGMTAIVRDVGVRADMVTVDAHLGYYYARTIAGRLREDVIRPARASGYRRIVVVGISLGGLGALLYEREHPGEVEAIVLLSPYLGKENDLFSRIEHAGGPVKWAAGRAASEGGVEEQIWSFIGNASRRLPPMWLAYGDRDSFRRGHAMLAGLLPAERVRVVTGGHDWATWQELWTWACAETDLFEGRGSGKR